MTAPRVGRIVLALVVGAGIGAGAAYALRPDPASSGTARPVAASPSVPTDDPYAPDIDYPPLDDVEAFDRYEIGGGPQLQTWEYAVPEGWVAYSVTQGGDQPIGPDEVDEHIEVRFRPAGEPLVGGYSMRVKAIDNHAPPSDEVSDKIADFEEIFEDFEVLDRSDSTVYFTFRTQDSGRLRYNYFRWLAVPGAETATLEMSIAGRAVDEGGMQSLFDQFAARARPVD